MSRIKQIEMARNYLQRALGALSNQETGMSQIKSGIRSLITRLDGVAEKKSKKINEQNQWWKTIKAGVANQPITPMSQEGYQKSLDQITQMIEKEENKLKDLEKKSAEGSDQLLSD